MLLEVLYPALVQLNSFNKECTIIIKLELFIFILVAIFRILKFIFFPEILLWLVNTMFSFDPIFYCTEPILIVKWRFEILPLFLLRKYTQSYKSKLWPFETMMSFIDFDVITFSTIIFNISFLWLRNIPHEILFWLV